MIFENESEMVAISNFMNNAKFGDLGVKDCAAVLNAVNIVNDAAKKFVDMRQIVKDDKPAPKSKVCDIKDNKESK